MWKGSDTLTEADVDEQLFILERKKMMHKAEYVNGKNYVRVQKGLWLPLTTELVLKSIYGANMKDRFTKGITGYSELVKSLVKEAKVGYIISVDGRRVWKKSVHSLLNYKLQSSGSVITKYWAFFFNEYMRHYGYTYEDYMHTVTVHDEFVVESKPKVTPMVKKLLKAGIEKTSEVLKLPANIEVETNVGKDWTIH